ncbi:prolipoprotein diacylglyceryl transferase [bacterium]|nr:prolipoprotein diacylglyceryl transferase [bacterium]
MMGLPVYFVVISVLLLGLVFWINSRSRKMHYSGTTALDLFFIVTLGGAIGARLFHIIFEDPQYYLQNPLLIFSFWNGGFVFYGGLIFGFLSGWVALNVKKQSFAYWLDFFTPVVSLGYAGGRVACFLTGCCYGKYCDLPWAIAGRHPTQLYAVAAELILFVVILKKEKHQQKMPGQLFAFWLMAHSVTRFFIEIFRDDPRGPEFGIFSISMLLSLVFFILSAFFLKALSDRK